MNNTDWVTLFSVIGFTGLVLLTAAFGWVFLRAATVQAAKRVIAPLVGISVVFGVSAVASRLTQAPFNAWDMVAVQYIVCFAVWTQFVTALVAIGRARP